MFSPSVSAIADAASALGWSGYPVPVRLAGENAWAIAALREHCGLTELPVRIAGVMVTGSASSRTSERASVFAGYCPRAVLVPEGRGVLPLQVDAAILGQGVVVAGAEGMRKLNDAGEVVSGDGEHESSAHRLLVEQVYARLREGREQLGR